MEGEEMTLIQAIHERHSVRRYVDSVLDAKSKATLSAAVEKINRESGLHIQLVCDEDKAFSGLMARYGNFQGVSNYIAMIGKKSPDLSEKVGYYGEALVLLAQQIGLNTCWVGASYKRVPKAFTVGEGEKLSLVIAVGYGMGPGYPRKSKEPQRVSNIDANSPKWFKEGVEAALLAPTAMNQQKFYFERVGDRVRLKAGTGAFAKVDKGIVKYHFEIGAGRENFQWIE